MENQNKKFEQLLEKDFEEAKNLYGTLGALKRYVNANGSFGHLEKRFFLPSSVELVNPLSLHSYWAKILGEKDELVVKEVLNDMYKECTFEHLIYRTQEKRKPVGLDAANQDCLTLDFGGEWLTSRLLFAEIRSVRNRSAIPWKPEGEFINARCDVDEFKFFSRELSYWKKPLDSIKNEILFGSEDPDTLWCYTTPFNCYQGDTFRWWERSRVDEIRIPVWKVIE